ncbi:hypothetical protein H5410_003629 [Solanum commersonii]|uniref:Uncharacterized protein n=1 Tax=Solanum commersonii TaxID=4109 RepID=A0A9J6B5J3_SOLCO|nr:hypothetical protein H5410_003629 [Solanum commersonii]
MSATAPHRGPIAKNDENYEGLIVESTTETRHGLVSIAQKFSRVTKGNSQGMSATVPHHRPDLAFLEPVWDDVPTDEDKK